MLEFRFRYLIFFSPDELSAMRILFYVSFAGLGLGLGLSTAALGLGLDLEGAGRGHGLVTAGLDYNTFKVKVKANVDLYSALSWIHL